jgi:hypothetical protein
MLNWVTFTGMSGVDGTLSVQVEESTFPSIEFEDPKETERKAREAVGKVTVSKTLSSPHRLIARLLQKDEERQAKYLASAYPSSWDAPFFDSQQERRRLRILNALFLAFSKMGYKVDVDGREARVVQARIGDQNVSLKIDWTGKNFGKEKRYTSEADNRPPYKLRLELERSSTKEAPTWWEDADGKPLEDQLSEVVVTMIVAADKQLQDAIKWHEEWEKQERERKGKWKMEQEVAREKARVEALHQASAQWRKACDIRDFVTAMQKDGSPEGATVDGKPLNEWCAWALAQADKLDPTIPR